METTELSQPPKDLTLRVADSIPPGGGIQDKWNMTTASDGSTWWYRYTGGNQGEGQNQFEVSSSTTENFSVSFHQQSSDFRILAYVNKSTPTDLSGVVAADQTSATVTDTCNNVGDYYWGLIVFHSEYPDVTIPCDPLTRNRN